MMECLETAHQARVTPGTSHQERLPWAQPSIRLASIQSQPLILILLPAFPNWVEKFSDFCLDLLGSVCKQ